MQTIILFVFACEGTTKSGNNQTEDGKIMLFVTKRKKRQTARIKTAGKVCGAVENALSLHLE